MPTDTRDALLDEGVLLLTERGYHGTGLKEVLARIAVPKGSFYNYFDSKEAFAVEVIHRYGEAWHGALDRTLARAGEDPVGALRRYFRAEIRRMEREPQGCLVGNLGGEVGAESERLRAAMVKVLRGVEHRLMRALTSAQARRQVRTDRKPDELATFMLNAWEGALIRCQLEGSVTPLRTWERMAFDELLTP